ncbi:glycoside hydrolase family 25 protein [Neorhizobium petrolearium]|uniref:Glycoside hydrolase family 25 protein n=1 Tax=Neorhizobium petrolearium TaxID=515361 RepID=A0ABY8MAW0_9HYPH|nr:glycoside hydrolase family 25 protein [Neorhizobium petrolearium]MCC2610436.1 glycoside hydrolase family 25 protein [Neorhizobium petrolearium]WGI70580.1 glycoside hydrolase family 25 protein [Neorhizobium petrolearium]
MPRLLLALVATAILGTGCTSTDYDFVETASVKKLPFKDSDPQDFGKNHPGRHEVHGIDLSKWNGDGIDWATVKKSGIAFVFIKATEGKDRIDPTFEKNWRGAAAAGIPHAPYHFYYFCSTPDEQADWFIANVPRGAVTLPPVLDAEWNHASPTCKLRPDSATVRDVLQRFMDRLEAHYGKRPIIYTSVDFHRDNLVGSFNDYQFWLRSVAAHPGEIYAGRRWAFWQYTSTGVVPGIKGETDINVFAGTAKNWNSWVATVSDNKTVASAE